MSLHVVFHQLSLSLGLVTSLGLLYYTLQYRDEPGVATLAVFVFGTIIWMSSDFFQIRTGTDLITAGMFLRFLGIEITILGTVLLGLEYSGREKLIGPKLFAVLAAKPLATLALIISPYQDLLFQTRRSLIAPWGYEIVPTRLFFAHVVYEWTLAVLGLGLLVGTLLRSGPRYREQTIAVTLALAIPLIFNFLFNSGFVPIDLTAPSFAVTAAVLGYASIRLQLLETVPVARQTVLEEMEDLVFVLDRNGTIIRENEAVRETFGADVTDQSVTDVLGGEAPTDPETEKETAELTVTIDGEERYFSVSKTSLTDFRGKLLGQVLVCRDTTEQKRREVRLRRREEELELLKDIQSEFLQRNLRDELNLVLSHARELSDDEFDAQRYQEITETSDRILEWETKARTIENLIEQEDTIRYDTSEIELLVDRMRERYPASTFETDLTDAAVTTVPQIDRALENLIDNAVEYNNTDQPRVELSVHTDGDRVHVEITDNGPGIEAHEIETIQSAEETQLKHGSGFGLWLVYWVVKKSDGTLSFETDQGTTVRLTFQRASTAVEPAR